MKNKYTSLPFELTLILVLPLILLQNLYSQSASPSNWMYPDGNLTATKYNKNKSERYQPLDSLMVKWMSRAIRGDIQPLIGNIVNNKPIINDTSVFRYAPNEITAVMGDTLIIMDGAGKILTKYPLRTDEETGNDIIGISALLDTASSINSTENSNRTLIIGFESLEAQREDSLGVTYLGGWKDSINDFGLIRRLGLKLKYDSVYYDDYFPNYSASLKPIYARKKYYREEYDPWASNDTAGYLVFVATNMSQPKIDANDLDMSADTTINDRPYLRGVTYFNLKRDIGFPLPDAGDEYEYRMHLAQEVAFAQPSISSFNEFLDSSNYILLPSLPAIINNVESVKSVQDDFSTITTPQTSYLFNFKINKAGEIVDNGLGAYVIDDKVFEYVNPRVRSYFVNLTDAEVGYEENYILATTEYDGIKSRGRSGLFLLKFDDGTIVDTLCDFYSTPDTQYKLPFFADSNHFWAVGIGNVDGYKLQNDWAPYYPNNPGNEIIVTQSSREFAYAGSRLMVLRYNSSPYLTPKASPPGTFLKNFDTICTYKIQGWLAAVNDLDGDMENNKDEILLVNGSKILILSLRDYSSLEFRSGRYFDTIFTHQFGTQTITSAAIADVDGDGRNDIVITTNEGIYIMGIPLERTIDVIGNSVPPFDKKTDWCFGDTLNIQWRNIIQGNSEVNILFQEYVNNLPVDSLVMLYDNYPNGNDTVTYTLIVDTWLAGKEGRIIIQDVINPKKNTDSTILLKFNKPFVTTNIGSFDTLYVGSEFQIKGNAICADKIELYYSFDSLEWIHIADAIFNVLIDGNDTIITDTFTIDAYIPCMSIFDCSEDMVDTLIYGKIIYHRYNTIDSSTIYPLVIRPSKFSLTIDPCEAPCPAKILRWKVQDTTLMNGIFRVYMSLDNGLTFKQIGVVPVVSEQFVWYVPSNDTVPAIIRFCENTYCYQMDTVIYDYKPKYIKIVAPNPLKIPDEAQIIYEVDENVDVTIRIIDQNNHFVRELIKNESRMTGLSYCEKWNGRMEDGTACSNGMYYIMFTMSNGIEEIYPIYIRN